VRGDTFGNDMVSKEPERQIDIMDRHVDKDTAGPRSVCDEEPRRVVLVTCLTSQD
jgi:hypothetical protein